MSFVTLLEKKLSVLNPSVINIRDESHLHIGHPGNTGGGHYALYIVSDQFEKMSLLKRHQLIYQLLKEELRTKIHALKIQAKTPNES